MSEVIQISGVAITAFGALLTMLLAVIAFFLSRLLQQFDGLTKQVENLNATMVRIDKDLSGDVSVLKTENVQLTAKFKEFDPVWDRVRSIENRLTSIEAGGCSVIDKCKV